MLVKYKELHYNNFIKHRILWLCRASGELVHKNYKLYDTDR